MKKFAVCLQIEPESYEWGLSARSIDFEMKSIVENDDRRVKQTMLYSKHVAIFINKFYPIKSVHDALRIFF